MSASSDYLTRLANEVRVGDILTIGTVTRVEYRRLSTRRFSRVVVEYRTSTGKVEQTIVPEHGAFRLLGIEVS